MLTSLFKLHVCVIVHPALLQQQNRFFLNKYVIFAIGHYKKMSPASTCNPHISINITTCVFVPHDWWNKLLCVCVPVWCLSPLPLLSSSDVSSSSRSIWTLVATVETTSLFSSCPRWRLWIEDHYKMLSHLSPASDVSNILMCYLLSQLGLWFVAEQVSSAVDCSSDGHTAPALLDHIC